MVTPAQWMARQETLNEVRVCEPETQESELDRTLRLNLADKVQALVSRNAQGIGLVEGLHLSYVTEPQQQKNCFYHLSVGLILRGHKRLMIGSDEFRYGPGSTIVTSMDIPTSYELMGVSAQAPFVSLSLRLNTAILAELLTDDTGTSEQTDVFSVKPSAREMLEDFSRLLSLLDRPEQITVRAPLIIRDIHCLALSGAGGACLRALYAPNAAGRRIRTTVHWIRENFREELNIEKLAAMASMAPSTFFKHFQTFTGFSPLQYQKRMRLYEAQQLLLRGDTDAGSAAYAVGYQSVSQFTREYKRLFGEPPGRHTKGKLEALKNKTV